MKISLIKLFALVSVVIVIIFVLYGRIPAPEESTSVSGVAEVSHEIEASPTDEEFEFNDKCLQAANQINNLVMPPKETDITLPQSVEEQILWLESDMDDGQVIENILRERLNYPDTQVFIAYDPSTSDEYQAIEIRCNEWPVVGNILYVVNRTKNKVLTVEANDYISLETFADIDSDGTTELVFQDVYGGNCWGCSQKRILHIAGQTVTEVEMPTKFLVTDIIHRPSQLAEGFVVYATDISWENALNLPHCCGPSAHRYFHVKGTTITDVSTLFKDKYQELFSLNEESATSIPGSVTNLLLREAMGERDEGWQQFVEDWKQVDTSEAMGVEDYSKRVLIEFTRQYQEQEQFTPFDISSEDRVRSRL